MPRQKSAAVAEKWLGCWHDNVVFPSVCLSVCDDVFVALRVAVGG